MSTHRRGRKASSRVRFGRLRAASRGARIEKGVPGKLIEPTETREMSDYDQALIGSVGTALHQRKPPKPQANKVISLIGEFQDPGKNSTALAITRNKLRQFIKGQKLH